MLPEIAKAYREGRVMLLLGAGASATSTDASGVELPMGAGLAKELAGVAKLDYSDEPLSIAYSAAAQTDSAGLEKFFVRRLTQTKPGPDLLELVRYRWSRIYTLNIDDATEAAIRASSAQKLRVYGRHDSLVEADTVFDSVQLIKLNGSADRLGDGLIFAPQEYGSSSADVPAWYRELGQDYIGQTFVFIGSKLNEPLLQHVIAESRNGTERRPQRGYLISPKVSALEQRHLEAANVVHVPGTLADFVNFLKSEVGPPPSGWDLATARRPELKKLATSLPPNQQRALNAVLVVQANTLPKAAASSGAIRNFYRGYKPTWSDILDGVPAPLKSHAALRGFGRHTEAFNMFKTAREAYASPQIEHAYAQQLLIIAEEAPSWADAEPLLVDAVKSLRNQKDDSLESDSYPIVSLAEGHVRVLRKFRPEAEAREAARTYANDLNRLRKKISNERLEETAALMTTYASTGAWTELRRTDTEWDIH